MEEDQSPKTPYAYLFNTGRVYDDQPMRVVSACQLKIYTFPFDIQNCSLTFGPYLHFGKILCHGLSTPSSPNLSSWAPVCSFLAAADVRMVEGTTAEKILQESTEVLHSSGEWEFVHISVSHSSLEFDEGKYSAIKYFVSYFIRIITILVTWWD